MSRMPADHTPRAPPRATKAVCARPVLALVLATIAAPPATAPPPPPPDDPLAVRTVVLANGLTVMLSVHRERPEVFGAVVVRTGGKNDPADRDRHGPLPRAHAL
jgi:hypothetical protein